MIFTYDGVFDFDFPPNIPPRNPLLFLDNNFTTILVEFRIPTVKLKIPGKLFLKSDPELLLNSSYSF